MRKLLGAALACALSLIMPAALAQQAPTSTVDQGKANAGVPWFMQLYLSGALVSPTNPLPMQGVPGGVPVNVYAGQYNSTALTLTNGQLGYPAVDVNSRLVLSPNSAVIVSSTALAANAATSTNQASEIAALGAPGDAAATNATGSWSIVSMLKGIYTALIGPTPAGTNSIGNVGLNAGSSSIGSVGLNAGTNTVGKVSSSVTPSDAGGTLNAGAGAVILAANPNRQFLAITNTGANPMLYRFSSSSPTATLGHYLAPNATVVFDAKVPVSQVTGFATSTTTYTITEGN